MSRRKFSSKADGARAGFVGGGHFHERQQRAKAIVKAATHYQDPKVLLEVSEDLTGAMKGLAVTGMDEAQMLQTR
jgi:pyridoxal 5'-phosphate synthase pdxS subunit